MGCHSRSYECVGRWANTFDNIVYVHVSLYPTSSSYIYLFHNLRKHPSGPKPGWEIINIYLSPAMALVQFTVLVWTLFTWPHRDFYQAGLGCHGNPPADIWLGSFQIATSGQRCRVQRYTHTQTIAWAPMRILKHESIHWSAHTQPHA